MEIQRQRQTANVVDLVENTRSRLVSVSDTRETKHKYSVSGLGLLDKKSYDVGFEHGRLRYLTQNGLTREHILH